MYIAVNALWGIAAVWAFTLIIAYVLGAESNR